MKKVIIIISTFFVLIIFIGCAKPETPKNFILLVDLSRSVDTGLTKWYQKVIRELVIPNLGVKDKLIILPVDKGSVTSSGAIFSIDFSKFEYDNEYGGLDRANIVRKNHSDSVASAVTRFTIEFESAIESRQSFGQATNIIGGIKEAKRYLDPHRENIVGILSDMQQESTDHSITFNKASDDPSTIERYLSSVENPDLTGVQVFVITGAQPNMTDKQYGLLKRFWTRYFSQNNAVVLDYSSGAPTSFDQLFQHS